MRWAMTNVVRPCISTVRNADLILILDKGRIAARGTHAELLESSEIYADIYSSQLLDDAVSAGVDGHIPTTEPVSVAP